MLPIDSAIILSGVGMSVQAGYEMTRQLRQRERQEGNCPRVSVTVFGFFGKYSPVPFIWDVKMSKKNNSQVFGHRRAHASTLRTQFDSAAPHVV